MFKHVRKRCLTLAVLLFWGTWLVSACTPTTSESGDAESIAGTANFYATQFVAFSAAWIDRPLDDTIIVDPLKPIPVIGHATGFSVSSAILKIQRGGTDLPDVTLTNFSSERPGLTRIDGEWQIPPLTAISASGEIIYSVWLVVNGSQTSRVVHLRQVLPTPTATSSSTPTPTTTPTLTSTATSSSTATQTATLTATTTSTLTTTPTATLPPTPTLTPTITPSATITSSFTPTPSPSFTATVTASSTFTATTIPSPTNTLTPSPGICMAYVSGQGDQQQANVRNGPGTLYPIIGQISAKDGRFTVTGKYVYADGTIWWQIQLTPDQKGWVSTGFVTLDGICGNVPDAVPPPLPCVIRQFSLDAAVILAGQATTLRWSVQGASSTTINGQAVKATGEMQVSNAGTYSLAVRCAEGGTKSASVTLTVNSPPPPPPGATCLPRAAFCSTNSQCCSGVCSPPGAAPSRCI